MPLTKKRSFAFPFFIYYDEVSHSEKEMIHINNYHTLNREDSLLRLNVDQTAGLSSAEAKGRLSKYGANKLKAKKPTPLLFRFLSQFADFMILVLIAAALLSFFTSYLRGEADFIDPIIIFTIIILNASMGVLQEAKAEKSLEALKKLAAPTALVLRDGVSLLLPAAALVPGDIIILETGQFIPADARLLTSVNLKVDEASLTGESKPVKKLADKVLKPDCPLAERRNMVYASSIVTYGCGTAVVTATGMDTEVGHIASMIMEDKTPPTPLQKRLAKTGKALGMAALFICVLIFICGTLQGRPAFDMFMTSVSLAVAAIPEGLPAIVTIMLSLGVERMARKNAVIRKLPAVETLGSATVICSDKTGTLTQNKMTVTSLASATGEELPSGDTGKFILSLAASCCNALVSYEKDDQIITGEPTECALVLAAEKAGISTAKLNLSRPRISEIPFDSEAKRMTTVHKEGSKGYLSITKGAFDMLLSSFSLCYFQGREVPLTKELLQKIVGENQRMTDNALRVLCVGYKKSPSSYPAEKNLVFAGLIGMLDPPRPEVKQAVATCKLAGITPVMITGDHILTALSIGKTLGIATEKTEAICGTDLDNMSEEALLSTIQKYHIFARVSPSHKVRIVKAFQARGNIVAMTGDGVNDAPALKAADIGCAMGITGTDVAKNAADMILTDDNFATIIEAVQEGRGIYDNIQKSIHFLLSCNVGEILTIFASILLNLPTPLLAVQLLWINLVTDSLPAISLGCEPPEANIMCRRPKNPKKGIFADGLFIRIILEGLFIGFLALAAFLLGSRYLPEKTLELGRTMCFCVLGLSQLFHSFNMRSHTSLFSIGIFSNKKLNLSFLLCFALQAVVISVPAFASVFQVIPLSVKQWLLCLFLAFLPIPVMEVEKNGIVFPRKE
jgi:Ca2+-transporting ATPase